MPSGWTLPSVRCVKGYCIKDLTGTDAQTERPYKGLLVTL